MIASVASQASTSAMVHTMQYSQQNGVAAQSVPNQWSAGQVMLSPADWVIAVRLMDWAVDFICELYPQSIFGDRPKATLPSDVELAMLRVRLAKVLDYAYSRNPEHKLHRMHSDYFISDSILQWANGDCEADPEHAWTASGCSSRPPARLADIMLATLGLPDYNASRGAVYGETKGLSRVLAAAMSLEMRVCTIWARDNESMLDDKRKEKIRCNKIAAI